MATFLTPQLSENYSEPVSERALAYYRTQLRNEIHELVVSHFLKTGLTKADLARRLGKAPEQITRWLGAPGNWEFDTLSDLLLGMGAKPGFVVNYLEEHSRAKQNQLPATSFTYGPIAEDKAASTLIFWKPDKNANRSWAELGNSWNWNQPSNIMAHFIEPRLQANRSAQPPRPSTIEEIILDAA